MRFGEGSGSPGNSKPLHRSQSGITVASGGEQKRNSGYRANTHIINGRAFRVDSSTFPNPYGKRVEFQ
jgi:hypothetical protein